MEVLTQTGSEANSILRDNSDIFENLKSLKGNLLEFSDLHGNYN